ncbi:hypothetical protein, partial [Mycobacterium tuberculosis]
RDGGGESVERGRVGVDRHRIGGANRLQVHSKLAGDVELAEEVDEVVGARVGGVLIGNEGLVEEISEAARCAGVGNALQHVVASAVR